MAAPPVFDAAFRAELACLFRWRRDVRRFRQDPIPPSMLEALLALAAGAPSVGLSQPWHFVTVEDPARRAAVQANFAAANARALAAQPSDRTARYAALKLAGLAEAPVHLAVFADASPGQGHALGRLTMPETTAYSAVLAIHTLWLAARAAGLGLGWVSILDPVPLTRTLDVPQAWQFIAYLCLGWPETQAETPELESSGWEQRQPLCVVRR